MSRRRRVALGLTLAGALIAQGLVTGMSMAAARGAGDVRPIAGRGAAVSTSPAGKADQPRSTSKPGAPRKHGSVSGGSKAPTATALAANSLGAAITFAEFPVDTSIFDQYDSFGIWFTSPGSASSPVIRTDGANPFSPVLAGSSGFGSSIRGSLVWPGTTITAAVDSFSLDVGYIDTAGTTVVEAYGADGTLLGSIPINTTGVVTVSGNFPGTTDFVIRGSDPAGWGIDNVRLGPESISPSQRDWSQSLGGSNPGQIPRNCNSGDPVSCSTGDYWETATDAAVPGRGPGLVAARTYNSLVAGHQAAADRGRFGFGWSDSYDSHTQVDTGGNVTVVQGNGSTLSFTPAAGGGYQTSAWTTATLGADPSGGYVVTYRDRTYAKYNAAGRLVELGDRNGEPTTLAYVGAQLTTVTDAAGRQLTYTYNADGTVATLTDPLGRTVHYAYDGGDLTGVTDPAGATTGYGYNAAHELTSVTDPRGAVTHNEFDANHRLVRQTDRMGRVTTWTYSGVADYGAGAAGVTTITDPLGHQTQLRFDGLGDLVSRTAAYGTASAQTWSYAYDTKTGHLVKATDPNTHTRQFTWDGNGDLHAVQDPTGATSVQNFDTFHQLTSITDPLGRVTTYGYDPRGNLTSVTRHLDTTNQDATITLSYGDPGHPGDITGVTDPSGRTTTYTYDSYGDRTDSTDGLGRRTHRSFNLDGWLTATTSPRGTATGADPARFTTQVTHDLDGRVTRIDAPAGQSSGFDYDANGNLVSATDAHGHVTTHTYNADDEPTKTTRAGHDTQVSYDDAGRVIQQIDGLGKITTFGYNERDQLVSTTDPLQRSTRRTYDPAGNLSTIVDALNRTTTYSYDNANRTTQITYSNGSPTESYVYDQAGQLVRSTGGDGTAYLYYDSLGRLTDYEPNNRTHELWYGYDLAGNLTSLSYTGGQQVTKTYDAAGQMDSVTDTLGNTTTFGFNPDGALARISYPNGVVSTRSYDDGDRVTNIRDVGPGANGEPQVILNLPYTRDADGLLASQNTTAVPTPTTNGINPADATTVIADIDHDLADRLAGAHLDASPLVGVESYAYDAGDNLISRTLAGVTDTFTYDAAHQLTQVSNGAVTTNYTYNAVGERTVSTSSSRLGTRTTYTYDQAGHLTQFAGPPVQTWNDIISSLPVTLPYTYNGLGLLSSLGWNLAEGSVPLIAADWFDGTYFVTGPGGLPIEQLTLGGVPLYLHNDQLHSTRVVTDSSARPVITFTYDSYGKTNATPIRRVAGVDATAITPIQFAGEWTDLRSGLIYLRSRWYDPVSANFLTRDPIEFTTGQPYSYANDNPVDYTDPTGQCPLCFALLAAALYPALMTTAQAADHVAHGCDPFEQMDWNEVGAAAIAGSTELLPVAGSWLIGRAATNGERGWLATRLAMRDERGSMGLPGRAHNELNAAARGVDVDHVWANGDLYTQVRGEQTRLVRVLSRGGGLNDVVIRELDGSPVTSMVISDESLAARLADGRWQ